MVIDSRFKVGDRALYQFNKVSEWREVVLTQHAPYPKGNCDGYYMHFTSETETDPITGVKPSEGGWTSVNQLKPIERYCDICGAVLEFGDIEPICDGCR